MVDGAGEQENCTEETGESHRENRGRFQQTCVEEYLKET